MSSVPWPAACDRFVALIDALGEDMPDRIVTHTVQDHLATCPTCCRAEAVLTWLLAGYRRTAVPALPPGSTQRLVDRVCGQWGTCTQGEKT